MESTNSLKSDPVRSVFQNEEEALAIETAVRTAVLAVMEIVHNITGNKLRTYQRRVFEKSKENETLKLKLAIAERELQVLRQRRFSDHQWAANSNLFSSATSTHGETTVENEGLSSNLNGLKTDPDSPCASTRVSCREATVSSAVNPDGPRIHATALEIPSSGTESVPSMESLDVKKELSDTSSFYIKCEMSDDGLLTNAEDHSLLHVHGDATNPEAQQHDFLTFHTDYAEGTFNSNYSCSTQQWPRAPTIAGQKRKLSGKERQRLYRERIRADPERHRAYLERDRRRHMNKKRLINDLPEHIQKLQRKAWREAARRCRARKKSRLQMAQTQPCHLSPMTDIMEGFEYLSERQRNIHDCN